MKSPPWVPMPRQCPLATAASCGPWTLALVVCLLWPATPTKALYSVNVSSSKSTEDNLPPSTVSRCAAVSHDVLWTRLNLAAPRLTLLGSSDDDDDKDDVQVSRHQSSVGDYESSPSDEFQSSVNDISQTVATSTSSPRRQHRRRGRRRRRRWWRRRGGRGRPVRAGRSRSEASSWNCRLHKRWKRTPSGVFPAYIQTGSCRTQSTCMLGMYACRPRRYLIKVLRRISADDSDDGCRPVPVVGPDVVYEQAWSLVDMSVTVACECSRRRRSGTYYRRPTDTRTTDTHLPSPDDR